MSLSMTQHSKQYRFFKKNLSVLLPCSPRVSLGLRGNSTHGFLLKNLYCLEWIVRERSFVNVDACRAVSNHDKNTQNVGINKLSTRSLVF